MPDGDAHTQAHVQGDVEPGEGPEHLTCLLLSHFLDVVVNIIVNFSDFVFCFVGFFFKFEVHVLVLSIRVFKYNSYNTCRQTF